LSALKLKEKVLFNFVVLGIAILQGVNPELKVKTKSKISIVLMLLLLFSTNLLLEKSGKVFALWLQLI
jgi:hypothetical protein